VKAYLIDDEALALRKLRRVLEETGRVKIVGESDNPIRALKEVRKLHPDVVITDIMMPGLSGLDAVRRLNKMPQVKAKSILLTVLNDPYLAEEARAAGVMGYVTKVSADRDLIDAINTVLSGSFYLSPILRIPAPSKR